MRVNIIRILQDLKHNVIAECGNSFECIKHFERSKDIIDIVLLDIIMPKAQGYDDGLDSISYIKELNSSTPILILTSDSTQKTVLKAIKEGADEYILKPISSTKLKEILDVYDNRKKLNILNVDVIKTTTSNKQQQASSTQEYSIKNILKNDIK